MSGAEAAAPIAVVGEEERDLSRTPMVAVVEVVEVVEVRTKVRVKLDVPFADHFLFAGP